MSTEKYWTYLMESCGGLNVNQIRYLQSFRALGFQKRNRRPFTKFLQWNEGVGTWTVGYSLNGKCCMPTSVIYTTERILGLLAAMHTFDLFCSAHNVLRIKCSTAVRLLSLLFNLEQDQ